VGIMIQSSKSSIAIIVGILCNNFVITLNDLFQKGMSQAKNNEPVTSICPYYLPTYSISLKIY
jgi:hypothetical protein